jgi:hypothetical protein
VSRVFLAAAVSRLTLRVQDDPREFLVSGFQASTAKVRPWLDELICILLAWLDNELHAGRASGLD